MARGTGKDHARWPLSLWGRDELLDLTPPAQHLLMVLWTHPDLSYCGAGEWHPGRIATRANGWTAAKVEQAGAELSAYSILIVDTGTDEFLIRFWIEEDGLWKQPNMAVSMANARAELASRTLRAVVVHEVAKIKAREPETSSWERQAVATLLSQKAIDPATLEPFTPTLTPAVTHTLIPNGTPTVTPGLTPDVTLSGGVGVDPSADPGPTPTPALSPTSGSFSKGGYVSGEPHLGGPLDLSNPPSPRCSKHRNAASDEGCGACADARRARDAWDTAAKAERKRVRADCPDCDEYGWTIDETGQTTPESVKCTHGAAVVSHA